LYAPEAHQISRAAGAGFEWPDIEGVFDKLEEKHEAARGDDRPELTSVVSDEIGTSCS
jgi:hypothetical protein